MLAAAKDVVEKSEEEWSSKWNCGRATEKAG